MTRVSTTGATDFYAALGLHRQINAWGTITDVGGSIMRPESVAAMTQAATGYVDIEQLMRRGGDRAATLIGVDAVCFTAGAAAGLVLGAAILLDRHQARYGSTAVLRVVTPPGHLTSYLRAAIPAAVHIDDSWHPTELEVSTDADTPAMLFIDVGIAARQGASISEILLQSRMRGIPTLLDAAAELPPKSNLVDFYSAGATIVVFSGGKQIRGPQSSGLLIASREIVDECLKRSTPHHGVARAMKLDKETIAGLLRAIEIYIDTDEHAETLTMNSILDLLQNQFSEIEDLTIERGLGRDGIRPANIPRLFLQHATTSARMIQQLLREGTPPILVGRSGQSVVINPQCLTVDNVDPIVRALRKIL